MVLCCKILYNLKTCLLVKNILLFFSICSCVHTYHYHPFPVYNITLPEEASYEIVYKLLNEFQMNMINIMTEWIENDAQMKEAYHTTEVPETTTKGKMIDADPEGRILKCHDY